MTHSCVFLFCVLFFIPRIDVKCDSAPDYDGCKALYAVLEWA